MLLLSRLCSVVHSQQHSLPIKHSRARWRQEAELVDGMDDDATKLKPKLVLELRHARVEPRVRLETLGSLSTRCLLCCVYAAALVALCLALFYQLGASTVAVNLTNTTACGAFSEWPLPQLQSPSAQQMPGVAAAACSLAIPSRNQTLWLAAVSGLSRLDGNLIVSLNLAVPIDSASEMARLAVNAVVYGSVNQTFGSELAYGWMPGIPLPPQGFQQFMGVANASVARQVSCTPGEVHCTPDLIVLQQSENLGVAGPSGFESVVVGVLLAGSSPDRAHDITGNSTLRVAWTAGAAEATDLLLRVLLAVTTIICAGAIAVATMLAPPLPPPPSLAMTVGCRPCDATASSERPPSRRWLPCAAVCDLPQRGIVLLMLVGTLLWQNPVSSAHSSVTGPGEAAGVLGHRAATALGWAVMLTSSLALVESTRDSARRVRDQDGSCRCGDVCKWLALALWGALAFASSFLLDILADPLPVFRQADATHPFGSVIPVEMGVRLAVGFGALYTALLALYLVMYGCSMVTAGRTLRGLPYAPTRYFQLTWRLFVWLQLVVVAFVICINAAPALGLLAQSGNVSTQGSPDLRLLQVFRVLTTGVQPTAELLLVSVYALLVGYAFLPPGGCCPGRCCYGSRPAGSSGTASGGDGGRAGKAADARPLLLRPQAVMLERAVAQAASIVGLQTAGAASVDAASLFSLEVTSWLYDFAQLAYVAPVVEAARESLRRDDPLEVIHGFRVVGVVEDGTHDILAVVLRREWRVVVTVRGTKTTKNVWLDLRASRSRSDVHGRAAQLAGQLPAVQAAFPLVHDGFRVAYNCIRVELQSVVRSALAAAGSGARLYLTGHSLGGAIATLAAVELVPEVMHCRRAHAELSRAGARFEARPVHEVMSSLVPLRGSRSRGRARDATGAAIAAGKEGPPSDPIMRTLGQWQPGFADRDDFDPFGASHDHDIRRGRRGALSGLLGTGLPGAGDGAVLVVFGSPRVGNSGFARTFNSAVPLAWRVEMERDVVTNLPKFCCLYSHVGTRVVLDELGNIIVDPSPLELSLRVRPRTSLNSHRLVAYRSGLREARIAEGLAVGAAKDSAAEAGDAPAAAGAGGADGLESADEGGPDDDGWERALV